MKRFLLIFVVAAVLLWGLPVYANLELPQCYDCQCHDGKDGKDGSCVGLCHDGKDGSCEGLCVNGKDGKDGLNGKDGKDGTNGRDGANGSCYGQCPTPVNLCANFDQSKWRFLYEGSVHTVIFYQNNYEVGGAALSVDGGDPVRYDWSIIDHIFKASTCNECPQCEVIEVGIGIVDQDCDHLEVNWYGTIFELFRYTN